MVDGDVAGSRDDADASGSFNERRAGLDLVEGLHGRGRGAWRRSEGTTLTEGESAGEGEAEESW